MLKPSSLLVAVCLSGPIAATAQVTVHLQSGLGLANVIDSSGTPLPDGNAVRLGYFEDGFNVPANAGLLPVLSLNRHPIEPVSR